MNTAADLMTGWDNEPRDIKAKLAEVNKYILEHVGRDPLTPEQRQKHWIVNMMLKCIDLRLANDLTAAEAIRGYKRLRAIFVRMP